MPIVFLILMVSYYRVYCGHLMVKCFREAIILDLFACTIYVNGFNSYISDIIRELRSGEARFVFSCFFVICADLSFLHEIKFHNYSWV